MISEYGIKIKNIEASTVFEFNNGVRDHFEYTDAMFVNSIFKDYLVDELKIKVSKNGYTRDIIGVTFNYGSRSFENEVSHLHKIAKNAQRELEMAKINGDIYDIDKIRNKQRKILQLIKMADLNKESYLQKNCDQLREYYYINGIDVPYVQYRNDGSEKKREVIHYQMLYRSTGKAKKGSCMFIRDKLYDKAIDFLRMGIRPDDQNPMLVELSAYSPLISSGIVGKVRIDPKNILILKDVDRFFRTNVISVETDEYKHCIAKKIDDYKLKNTLFDGEALLDEQSFPCWGNGFVLLRHHFCKTAAFKSKIQIFFRDYFGEDYDNAIIKDMFGVEHYAKDIQLITTDNAMKWIKFGVSYDYWCEWVNKNDCNFGVVKTAHGSKLGSNQKMSYQMVNSLDMSIMDKVSHISMEYIEKLKTDIDVFLDYLHRNSNFSNDFDVLIEIMRQNPDFEKSDYFRNRRKEIIRTYVLNFRSGRVLQNAENLTIVGSPYALLLYAAKGYENAVDEDCTFSFEEGTIQCYTERFADGEFLAAFRSPFNSKNNLSYLHNHYHEYFKRYFDFGKQIIAVNMIGTDMQDRNNGLDMDSDFLYVTNQESIVNHARRCYKQYPTIVNNIPKSTKKYENNLKSFVEIDIGLAKSQIDIGESSNLAQLSQTYSYNFDDKKYQDYTCILSVLAQVAIDSAKRQFDIDLSDEIKNIKKGLNIRKNKYPIFWASIKKNFNRNNINPKLKCPMNCLSKKRIDKYRSKNSTIPISEFFIKHKLDINRKTSKKVEDLISKYALKIQGYNCELSDVDYLLLRSDFDDLIDSIRKTSISGNYIGLFSWLLDRAFEMTPDVKRNCKLNKKLNTNKSLLLKVLYEVNSKALLQCFSSKM